MIGLLFSAILLFWHGMNDNIQKYAMWRDTHLQVMYSIFSGVFGYLLGHGGGFTSPYGDIAYFISSVQILFVIPSADEVVNRTKLRLKGHFLGFISVTVWLTALQPYAAGGMYHEGNLSLVNSILSSIFWTFLVIVIIRFFVVKEKRN